MAMLLTIPPNASDANQFVLRPGFVEPVPPARDTQQARDPASTPQLLLAGSCPGRPWRACLGVSEDDEN